MIDVTELVRTVFSGLSSLVIEDVSDRDGVIAVRARTAGGPVPCPRCGSLTGQVHGYYERTAADVPADGRPIVVHVRVRRMRCPDLDCKVQTFREQVRGSSATSGAPAADGPGRGGRPRVSRAAPRHGCCRRWASRCRGIPRCRPAIAIRLPGLEVPRVLGIDDFALRRGQVYATILIDAQTGQRVDVLASRKADVPEAWLRTHPGVGGRLPRRLRCLRRGGPPALPGAVQAGDRWHLWQCAARRCLTIWR